ncbi:hypothetical protein [Microbacterium sp. NIBRBAC000506063]|uniref:terminase small subunit n=1 Tax=Microbacterium sp. NIBRBAC000506063 TaxID=2734618 RepID=UPI001BB6339D|nr:hypothetical protein [Microbacterium sp. NIBRBAC000506063]QTV79474.1 hypothetical protein KAE78_11260 [Microbacterium sp. NIBRBAC000506063]
MAMSPEERRARDAARKRRTRAAARAQRDAELADARASAEAEAPTTMRDAVKEAIAAAKWLTGTDSASTAQATVLAGRIDLLEHEGETTKALSAHRALSQVLNDLGITATKRLQYELRSLKHAPKPEGDDERESSEGEAPSGDNVTKFQRPAKRRA